MAGTNKEGYLHSLIKTFGVKNSPCKAALSRVRKKVCYTFFKDKLIKLLSDFEPKRLSYRGMKIYAIDGLQVHLPRTDDIINAGYSGRSVSKYRESYTPRMYLVHAYDVLSQVTKDLKEACYFDELHGAKNMIKNFEKNSLTIYDRLYISKGMICGHKKAGNHFLMRARRSSFKEVQNFYKSKKQKSTATIEGVKIYMIKVKNPKTGKKEVFITDMPKSWCTPLMIQKLYNLRWEVETSFKDLVDTLKLQQWHSKFINGIRQELYTLFWLMNYARIEMNKGIKKTKIRLTEVYEKANFKLIVDYIKQRLPELFKRKQGFSKEIKLLIKLSTEKRKHYSRSYKRELKGAASPYPRNNTVWNVS